MNVYLSLAEKTGLLQGIPYLHPLWAKHSLRDYMPKEIIIIIIREQLIFRSRKTA
jgi:hypothetical protein